MTLQEKTALVTGASRGLGKALTIELARRGVNVVAVARGESDLRALVEQVKHERAHTQSKQARHEAGDTHARGNEAQAQAHAGATARDDETHARWGEVHTFAADIGDKQSTHAIAGAAAAMVGPIDLLIHDASTLGATPLPRLLDTDCETLEDVLRINLIGPFRLSKVIAGSMVLRRSGTLVHISSDAAIEAYPGWGAYGASKAALDHMSRTWAAELEGTGVRSLSIDPGEMDTQMHADAIPDADRTTLADPATVASTIAEILADRSIQSGARLVAPSWRPS